MDTVLYGFVKFLAYGGWCFVGMRLVKPDSATIGHAVGLGVLRWFLGLGFGVAIFILAGSLNVDAVPSTYFGI